MSARALSLVTFMTHNVWLLHNVSTHTMPSSALFPTCFPSLCIYIIYLYINRHIEVVYIKRKSIKIKKGKSPEKLKKIKKIKNNMRKVEAKGKKINEKLYFLLTELYI